MNNSRICALFLIARPMSNRPLESFWGDAEEPRDFGWGSVTPYHLRRFLNLGAGQLRRAA